MNEREFEKIFWDFEPRLLRYANRYLGAACAQDAVAEALLMLWKKDQPFPTDESSFRQLKAFAFQILVGIIRNEHRAQQRKRQLGGALQEQAVLIAQYQYASGAAHSQHDVDRLLDQLVVSDREVLQLVNAGFNVEELAQILGCTVSAAAKRRTRARARLWTILEQGQQSTPSNNGTDREASAQRRASQRRH